MKGLEPLPLSELDPKSSASTNSATPAYRSVLSVQNYDFFVFQHLFYTKKGRNLLKCNFRAGLSLILECYTSTA